MLRQTMCLLILTRSSGKLRAVTAAHWRKNNNVHLSEERSIVISGSDIPDIPCQFVLYLYGSFESNHKSVTFNFSSSETSCADAVLTPTGLSSVKMQSSRHQERCGHVLSALAASHGLCIFLQETKTMTRYSQTGIQDNHLVAKCNLAILGNRDYKYAWVGKIYK